MVADGGAVVELDSEQESFLGLVEQALAGSDFDFVHGGLSFDG